MERMEEMVALQPQIEFTSKVSIIIRIMPSQVIAKIFAMSGIFGPGCEDEEPALCRNAAV